MALSKVNAGQPAKPEPTAAEQAAAKQAEIAAVDAEAAAIALKRGAAHIKWIPWPQCPEEQWVPMRTCTLPELDAAYLFAHGQCKHFGREGDEELFERWYNYALLSNALRDGWAVQKGLEADGSIDLILKRQNFDNPMFSSPNNLRESMRDEPMFEQLMAQYVELCALVCPLSTYSRLHQEKRFHELTLMLKKKPGPIGLLDRRSFRPEEMGDLIAYLVSFYPANLSDDSQD